MNIKTGLLTVINIGSSKRSVGVSKKFRKKVWGTQEGGKSTSMVLMSGGPVINSAIDAKIIEAQQKLRL